MRLLDCHSFLESDGGGIERVAGHLCRNLAAQGHVSMGRECRRPAPTNSAITALPLRCINPTERLTGLPMPISGPAGLRTLSRAISRADTVIVHDALYCTSIAAMILARAKGVPVIIVQHIAVIEFRFRKHAETLWLLLIYIGRRVPMLALRPRSCSSAIPCGGHLPGPR